MFGKKEKVIHLQYWKKTLELDFVARILQIFAVLEKTPQRSLYFIIRHYLPWHNFYFIFPPVASSCILFYLYTVCSICVIKKYNVFGPKKTINCSTKFKKYEPDYNTYEKLISLIPESLGGGVLVIRACHSRGFGFTQFHKAAGACIMS